jgi:hypothetical protein
MHWPFNAPQYDYVAFIDEAGDIGTRGTRPMVPMGSSEWFVLAAVVVSADNEQNCKFWIRDILKGIASTQRTDLHFRKLQKWKKQRACALLASYPIRCFVICSNKRSLIDYRNERVEKMRNQDWFYSSLTRYLLERVTKFVAENSMKEHGDVRKIKIIYSDRNGINVGQMAAYYEKLKNQTRSGRMVLNRGNLVWETYHSLLLRRGKPDTIAGLQCADLLASAFFKACDHYHTGGCDPSYAMQFRNRMGRIPDRASGKIAGFGVKVLPNFSPKNWRSEQSKVFCNYGYPDEWWPSVAHGEPYLRRRRNS